MTDRGENMEHIEGFHRLGDFVDLFGRDDQMTNLEYRIAVRATDRCESCIADDMPAVHPARVSVRGDDAAARYECQIHDAEWVTHWSVAALGIAP